MSGKSHRIQREGLTGWKKKKKRSNPSKKTVIHHLSFRWGAVPRQFKAVPLTADVLLLRISARTDCTVPSHPFTPATGLRQFRELKRLKKEPNNNRAISSQLAPVSRFTHHCAAPAEKRRAETRADPVIYLLPPNSTLLLCSLPCMQQGPLAGQASGSTRPPEAASLQVPTSAPSRYLRQWAGIHCTWLAQLKRCPSIGAGRQRKRITTQHLPPQHRAPESVLSEQRESCANSKPACCVRWVLTVCWTGTVLLHPFMLDR